MATGGLFGVTIMLIFAAIGYLMTSYGYSVVIFIIAFFLGPRFEISLSQSLALMNGDWRQIINYPIALVLLVLAAVSLVWFLTRPQLPDDGEILSIED